MQLNLVRHEALESGIFGNIETPGGKVLFCTLEHAYSDPSKPLDSTTYFPKFPDGTYTCVLGKHTLTHHPEPFDAYEITNVPGHTNILLHIGNFNSDSEGCVLLGMQMGKMLNGGSMLMASTTAFNAFMKLLDGAPEFTLVVESVI